MGALQRQGLLGECRDLSRPLPSMEILLSVVYFSSIGLNHVSIQSLFFDQLTVKVIILVGCLRATAI
jgi:hypothetical protein